MQVITNAAVQAAPNYNEAEIRFHIIDPIIRHLGYPSEDNVYISLEEKLEYPYHHIGRRSKKDLPLGFPDYRAGLKGARGSFTVEAKAGNVAITEREIEQAHSYAAHAQVGANYFVLCNGKILLIFETLSGTSAKALVQLPLNEVNNRFHEIENILSPKNLERNCKITYDTGLKISEGLGSSAIIRSGSYVASDIKYQILLNGQDCTELMRRSVPQITEMERQFDLLKTTFELRVFGGVVKRGEEGRIVADVNFAGVTIPNYKAMTIMGINKVTLATSDKFISTDSGRPTIFESTTDFLVPRGTSIPSLFGETSEAEIDVKGSMFIKAAMYIEENKALGQYLVLSDSSPEGAIEIKLELSGEFELLLQT